MEERTIKKKACKNAPTSWVLHAKQAKKRNTQRQWKKELRKKPARMHPHHGSLMPNEQKQGTPKGNGRKNLEKGLQE